MRRRAIRRPDGSTIPRRRVLAAALIVVAAAVLLLAMWGSAPSWLAPAHQHLASAGHWMQGHWLNAVAITAWGTIAMVAVAIVPLAARRRQPKKEATGQLSRERALMLRQVRYKWITGVLEPSLADAAGITLGLKRQPDVLELGKRVLRRIGNPPESFPQGTPIGKIFEQVGSGLLILGGPGAGKTTLLLQLADELLTRAEADPDQPIPVVFHLSSWGADPKPLREWIAGELALGYDVPPDTAATWLDQDVLALLLDGLDEVSAARRADCAKVINEYRRDHGLSPMAVCSRTEELEQLTVRFRLHEAVELQPPTDTEIDRYLTHLEATGTPLDDVRTAFDTDESLRELLRSPLMLHVIALAYHGRPAPALSSPGSADDRQAQLWRAYIARMFEQRPLAPNCAYTPEQATRWLRWLARGLYDRDEAEFRLHALTQSWVPVTSKSASSRWKRKRRIGYRYSETATNAAGQVVELREAEGPFIWSAWRVMFFGALAMFPVAGLAALGAAIATGVDRGPVAALITALVLGLGTLVWAAALSRLGSLTLRRLWQSEPAWPGQRVWQATRDASRAGGFTALYLGTEYGSVLGLVNGPFVGMLAGLIMAVSTGTLVWVGYGGGSLFLHHFAIRAELVRAEAAPWRLPLFLEAMAERQILHRSGGTYLFIHRTLRDFLATGPSDHPPTTGGEATARPSAGESATR